MTYVEISRDDMHTIRTVTTESAPLAANQVTFRVDRFGLTANNITYGVFGRAMRYWDFFPSSDLAWGRLPVWGFATTVESNASDVQVGDRVYGYFPMGSELVITAGRADGRSVVDVSAHRADLPSPYNRYMFTSHDPAYQAAFEDLQILLWPLFYTSFMVEDFLDDSSNFGADNVVISSASSKTSIGVAFLLKARGASRVVGLTSANSVPFVQQLGCYDDVVAYDEIETLPQATSTYVDVSGNRDVTHRVHHHFGANLTYSMVVGDTHWDHQAELSLPPVGPKPEFLFAPVQMAKRTKDWGRDELETRVAKVWREFTAWCATWLEVRDVHGAEAIAAAYVEVLNGRVAPTVGTVCTW